ncbi:MAG: hypothetical protein ACNA7J_11365, partial [Wenzhouxiangella sp.]
MAGFEPDPTGWVYPILDTLGPGWLDAQARCVQAEWRDAEALFESEHRFIERHLLVGRAAGFP